jgi:uncharacterized protein (UPF0332 family)
MESILEDNRIIFVKRYLEKSNEALIDAKINIENERFSAALNRIYYTIFYSVIALGYKENFITSKHKQLLGWFNKFYIHEIKYLTWICSKFIKKHMKIDRNPITPYSSSLKEMKWNQITIKRFISY